MAIETPMLTEMEMKLATDADGSSREKICSQLNAYVLEVRRQMSAGLAPEEYVQAGKFNDALTAADEVVRAIWRARACRTPC